MRRIAKEGEGVIVLLNCGESGAQLLSQFDGTARSAHGPERGRMDLRSTGLVHKYCATAAFKKCDC